MCFTKKKFLSMLMVMTMAAAILLVAGDAKAADLESLEAQVQSLRDGLNKIVAIVQLQASLFSSGAINLTGANAISNVTKGLGSFSVNDRINSITKGINDIKSQLNGLTGGAASSANQGSYCTSLGLTTKSISVGGRTVNVCDMGNERTCDPTKLEAGQCGTGILKSMPMIGKTTCSSWCTSLGFAKNKLAAVSSTGLLGSGQCGAGYYYMGMTSDSSNSKICCCGEYKMPDCGGCKACKKVNETCSGCDKCCGGLTCQNGKCVKTDTSCVTQGNQIDLSGGQACCSGLTPLAAWAVDANGTCVRSETVSKLICGKCGNKVCETGENKCNCPRDCQTNNDCPAPRVPSAGTGNCIQSLVWAKNPIKGDCCKYTFDCQAPLNWKLYPNEAACKTTEAKCVRTGDSCCLGSNCKNANDSDCLTCSNNETRIVTGCDTNCKPIIKCEPIVCPTVTPPASDFCQDGTISPIKDDHDCTIGHECINRCTNEGSSCCRTGIDGIKSCVAAQITCGANQHVVVSGCNMNTCAPNATCVNNPCPEIAQPGADYCKRTISAGNASKVTVYEQTDNVFTHEYSISGLKTTPGTFGTTAQETYKVYLSGDNIKITCSRPGNWQGYGAGHNIVAVKLSGVADYPNGLWASVVRDYHLGTRGDADSRFNALGSDTQLGPWANVKYTLLGDDNSDITVGFEVNGTLVTNKDAAGCITSYTCSMPAGN